MREEASDLAQEGTFRFHPSKLLQEGEGDDLRVGETLEGFVMLCFGVEEPVGVVHEAEQD